MRVALLISYDGTAFSGWQVQPGRRTVQGVLEEAYRRMAGKEARITASGRTDAGVHAEGQVAVFDAAGPIPADRYAPCFNTILPDDVKVLASARVDDAFDVTGDVVRKTYCYRAYHAPAVLPLRARYAVRLQAEPDLSRMRDAAQLLLGEHDFAAFRAVGFTSRTSVRTIYAVRIERESLICGDEYTITVCGSGFLYNMVRIIAGELFAIGCGKQEGITQAFATGKRECLARTMPPDGLTLCRVEYDRLLFGGIESEHGIF